MPSRPRAAVAVLAAALLMIVAGFARSRTAAAAGEPAARATPPAAAPRSAGGDGQAFGLPVRTGRGHDAERRAPGLMPLDEGTEVGLVDHIPGHDEDVAGLRVGDHVSILDERVEVTENDGRFLTKFPKRFRCHFRFWKEIPKRF